MASVPLLKGQGNAWDFKWVWDSTLSPKGVSVLLRFIRVDHDGEEAIGPKWLVPCSPPVLADG